MRLKEFMSPERAFACLECTDKAGLIGKMVDRMMESIPRLDKELAVHNLLEKEGVFSTGVGGGIAIPHAVVPGIDSTLLSVAQLKEGIDYKAVDNEKVYVVFMLLSPEGRTHEHIKLLARIARLCFHHEFVDIMKNAKSDEDLYKVIAEEDAKYSE